MREPLFFQPVLSVATYVAHPRHLAYSDRIVPRVVEGAARLALYDDASQLHRH